MMLILSSFLSQERYYHLSLLRGAPRYPFAALSTSRSQSGVARDTDTLIDRARPRFFIRHFIFIIPPPRERDRGRNEEEEAATRRRSNPIPIASAHTRIHTRTSYCHHRTRNVRSLYDAASNRSWYQTDIPKHQKTHTHTHTRIQKERERENMREKERRRKTGG